MDNQGTMNSSVVDELQIQPDFYKPMVSMQQPFNESSKGLPEIENRGQSDDNTNHGIDITKSLYHLRLHGFDMVAKNHMNTIASSPSRIACVTPAVSPAYNSHSHRKQVSQSQSNHTTFSSRPLSPNFLEKTPTRNRRSANVPFNETSVVARSVDSKTRGDDTDVPQISTSNHMTIAKCIETNLYQPIRPTTISDGMDEVEVMLESSASFDSYEDNDETWIHSGAESPRISSLLSNRDDDIKHGENHSNTVSPQTPTHLNFCGIPSWCDTISINRNLYLDDHRTSNEWSCPTTTGCCIPTNENDPANLGLQISLMQSVLQNHICSSLGDSFEALCWQKSTAAMVPTTNVPVHSIPLLSTTDENRTPRSTNDQSHAKTASTKHRRSSTLPTYRRTEKFVSLRYNLHPFYSDPSVSLQKLGLQPHSLSKSQSFQYVRSQQQHSLPNTKKKYSQSEVGLVATDWECGVLDFATIYDGDNTKMSMSERLERPSFTSTECSNDDGYESDPELFCREDKIEQPNHIMMTPQTSYTVQEFLNERNTFICHSDTSNKSVAVHVWIELGQQLYDSLVLPKICWKPILSPINQNTHQGRSKRTSMIVGTVSSMELLNICRIRSIDTHNRKQYPFAQKQRLISIQSTDGIDASNETTNQPTTTTLILEARSIADRIRYTNLLKLTVSTLAAKFVTNDPHTLTMFFHNPNISDLVG
jgi:hypothetical protein